MSDKCCWKRVSLGQGTVAMCGDNFYSEKFVCDKCKIAKQAEQIKLLREALDWAEDYTPFSGDADMNLATKALNQTGGEKS